MDPATSKRAPDDDAGHGGRREAACRCARMVGWSGGHVGGAVWSWSAPRGWWRWSSRRRPPGSRRWRAGGPPRGRASGSGWRASRPRPAGGRPGGRVEAGERAVLSEGPDQARPRRSEVRRQRSSSTTPGAATAATADVDRGDPAQTREEEGGADLCAPAVDVVVARRGELGLLAADAPQARAVEQVDGPGLAGDGHLSVGEEDRLHRQIEVASRCPTPRCSGAKNWSSCSVGESSRTASLSS